jgi:hypothetical protein
MNGLMLSIVMREDESDVGASLDVQNVYGMWVIDIIHHRSHVVLTNILRQWESIKHKNMGIPPMGSMSCLVVIKGQCI